MSLEMSIEDALDGIGLDGRDKIRAVSLLARVEPEYRADIVQRWRDGGKPTIAALRGIIERHRPDPEAVERRKRIKRILAEHDHELLRRGLVDLDSPKKGRRDRAVDIIAPRYGHVDVGCTLGIDGGFSEREAECSCRGCEHRRQYGSASEWMIARTMVEDQGD